MGGVVFGCRDNPQWLSVMTNGVIHRAADPQRTIKKDY